MKVYSINKKLGQTPLEALEAFRKAKKISPAAKLTYAGRLDPMATGVLLILEGATQADREKYMGLPKVYEAQVLFGFSTDSFDLLGLPSIQRSAPDEGSLNRDSIIKSLKHLTGKVLLPIPPYSSVPYKGKPLFEWARAGKLKEKDWPKREMEIKSIKLVNSKQLSANSLLKYIQKNIPKVKGDFRQKEILKAWSGVIPASEPGSRSRHPERSEGSLKYSIISLSISCSSGTYIRSIANHLGGTLYSLKRVSVGKLKMWG